MPYRFMSVARTQLRAALAPLDAPRLDAAGSNNAAEAARAPTQLGHLAVPLNITTTRATPPSLWTGSVRTTRPRCARYHRRAFATSGQQGALPPHDPARTQATGRSGPQSTRAHDGVAGFKPPHRQAKAVSQGRTPMHGSCSPGSPGRVRAAASVTRTGWTEIRPGVRGESTSADDREDPGAKHDSAQDLLSSSDRKY
ncbi:hypothetical protein GCM10020221_10800 [Streptomyces thioluteus]|uniref:Uncharacterized protein n=1 Tax=Streptomyces thioluteus TaxID=66431 RepID=A0ABN3WJL3_STRTU